MPDKSARARWLMIFTICVWGCSFVATKSLLEQISPLTIICLRFFLGTVLLVGISIARGKNPLPPREAWPQLALMGFVGVFVHQLLQVTGLVWTSAINTGWLIALVPIWSAVLSAIFLKERFEAFKVIGLIGGFAGAALVISRGRVSLDLFRVPATKGDFLVLLSTVNWAVYSIIGHGVLKKLGAARATTGMMLFGWLMVVPLFLYTGKIQEIKLLTGANWLGILFLGFGCSGLGYLFYYAALEQIEVSRVASFLYAQPLITLASAVILLNEPVGLVTILGGLLVLGSVFLVQRTATL